MNIFKSLLYSLRHRCSNLTAIARNGYPFCVRAIGAAVAHFVHTEGVTSSNLVSPILQSVE